MSEPVTRTDPLQARSVLVIDDEAQIRRAVRNALRDVTDRLLEAETGARGIDLAAAERPELVVLDLGLPDMPGVEVCREIRRWATMPIVVLTARHGEEEKVELLNAGADDYVTKPFSIAEFAARVNAQLRRARTPEQPSSPVIHGPGGLQLDFVRRMASRNGEPIHLTPLEWDILRALIREPGRTFTHQQLYAAVWGRQFGNPQQNLRVHITNLRRKIELDSSQPQLIVTEPGVGYRIEMPREA